MLGTVNSEAHTTLAFPCAGLRLTEEHQLSNTYHIPDTEPGASTRSHTHLGKKHHVPHF